MNRVERERELECFREWLDQLGFDDSVSRLSVFREGFYKRKGWVRDG